MGCSRGGFSAQIFAQIVHDEGYAHYENSDEHNDMVVERLQSRTENATPTPTAQARVRALYALDPVGSCGIALQTPSTFFGFNSNHLAGSVDHARVVLMFGERCIGFRPNIYSDPPQSQSQLQQTWFHGSHGDAWGPSVLALHVLAYILSDLESNHFHINYKKLWISLQHWVDAPYCQPPPLRGVQIDRKRCRPPVGGTQCLHESLTAAQGQNNWQQQYNRTASETDLLALLMAITQPQDLTNSPMATAIIQTAIPQLTRLLDDPDLYDDIKNGLLKLAGLDNRFYNEIQQQTALQGFLP